MGIVLLAGKARTFVSSDTEMLYGINGPVANDFQMPYSILVSRDWELQQAILVSQDTNMVYTLAPLAVDTLFTYSLRSAPANDVIARYDLGVLHVEQDFEAKHSIAVSQDFEMSYDVLGLVSKDTEMKWNMALNVEQDYSVVYDISIVNPIHRDFLAIYTLYDPSAEIISTGGFSIVLEGEV